MAIIEIRTPPDGDDLTSGAAQRFNALIGQLTPKQAVIRILKLFVRQRELQLLQRSEQALAAQHLEDKRQALAQDPDLGPEEPI